MSESKIENWVKLVLQNEEFINFQLSEIVKTDTAAGLYRNMFFVSVKIKDKNNAQKTIDLVIKASQENENLRQESPVEITFRKEIFMYEKVHKSFLKFQNEVTTVNLLDFLPRCYATQITENSEVLIFPNLNTLGLRIFDKSKFMDFDHLKIVMEAFGRWHAFSFALKSKRNEIFQVLIKNNVNMLNHFFRTTKSDEAVYEVYEQTRTSYISSAEEDLLKKTYFSKEDAMHNFNDLFSEDLDYSVILHGDCFCENLMFGYNDDKVDRVQMIDWQSSGLSSPVIDLSHFFYPCCDTEKYKDISVFLKIYYNSLSQTLKTLGCDPEILYPYSKLKEHWVRFSRWGILLQALIVKFALWKADDVPDFGDLSKGKVTFLDIIKSIKVSDEKEFSKRIRNNLIHYAENLKIDK